MEFSYLYYPRLIFVSSSLASILRERDRFSLCKNDKKDEGGSKGGLFYPPIHDILQDFPEFHRIMADVVVIIDDISLDNLVGFPEK